MRTTQLRSLLPFLPVLTVNDRTFNIVDRYTRGESCEAIARDLGVSRQRINGILEQIAVRFLAPQQTARLRTHLDDAIEVAQRRHDAFVIQAKRLYPPPATVAEKTAARVAFSAVVAKGEIQRPTHCSLCNDDSRRIQGHHHDYSKPLEVTWVCTACHSGIHTFGKPSQH